MSESDRTPGKRNRSQVPPRASRASRMAQVLPGQRSCRWQAAPMPEMPAPTISTSTCSPVTYPTVASQVCPATSPLWRSARATGCRTSRCILSTDAKVELITQLVDAGARRVEAVSFAHPKLVPGDGRRRGGDGAGPAPRRRLVRGAGAQPPRSRPGPAYRGGRGQRRRRGQRHVLLEEPEHVHRGRDAGRGLGGRGRPRGRAVHHADAGDRVRLPVRGRGAGRPGGRAGRRGGEVRACRSSPSATRSASASRPRSGS